MNLRYHDIAVSFAGPVRLKKTIKKSGVGRKIKKLEGEGKPRKQAIAIALSMAGLSKK